MRIRRSRPTVEWTQIPNVVARDYRLSWRARGLLLELLSYPPGWETSINDMVKRAQRQAKALGTKVEGRDAMRIAARELRAAGYLVSTKRQDDRGRWHTETEVTDAPMWELLNTPAASPPRDDSTSTPEAATDVSAGHTEDGISVSGATCDNTTSPQVTPKTGKPTSGKPTSGELGATPKNDPKTVDPDPEETDPATHTETPDISAELTKAREIAGRLNLAKVDAKPKQVVQVTHALARALRGGTDPARLEQYAHAKIGEARTVKYLLGAFEPDRLAVDAFAYISQPEQRPEPSPCERHPGTARRADGECAGCWTDRRFGSDPLDEPGEPVDVSAAKSMFAAMLAGAGAKRR